MMNDDLLSFEDRWLVFRLRFTCYLVLMFFVLCDSVNCRVVWGLDHKAGDLCGWLLIVDGFGWRLA